MELVEKCYCIVSKDRTKALIKNSKGRVIGNINNVKNIIRYPSKVVAENIKLYSHRGSYNLPNGLDDFDDFDDFEVLECELKLTIK